MKTEEKINRFLDEKVKLFTNMKFDGKGDDKKNEKLTKKTYAKIKKQLIADLDEEIKYALRMSYTFGNWEDIGKHDKELSRLLSKYVKNI